MTKRRVTNGEAVQAPAGVDETHSGWAAALTADTAGVEARAAVEQYEQQAWAMRPTEHAAVRAVLALLWLIALELRALRRERAG